MADAVNASIKSPEIYTPNTCVKCKKCKAKLITGVKCEVCNEVYHQSCARLITKIKIIDNETINCCNGGGNLSDKKASSLKLFFPDDSYMIIEKLREDMKEMYQQTIQSKDELI